MLGSRLQGRGGAGAGAEEAHAQPTQLGSARCHRSACVSRSPSSGMSKALRRSPASASVSRSKSSVSSW